MFSVWPSRVLMYFWVGFIRSLWKYVPNIFIKKKSTRLCIQVYLTRKLNQIFDRVAAQNTIVYSPKLCGQNIIKFMYYTFDDSCGHGAVGTEVGRRERLPSRLDNFLWRPHDGLIRRFIRKKNVYKKYSRTGRRPLLCGLHDTHTHTGGDDDRIVDLVEPGVSKSLTQIILMSMPIVTKKKKIAKYE